MSQLLARRPQIEFVDRVVLDTFALVEYRRHSRIRPRHTTPRLELQPAFQSLLGTTRHQKQHRQHFALGRVFVLLATCAQVGFERRVPPDPHIKMGLALPAAKHA